MRAGLHERGGLVKRVHEACAGRVDVDRAGHRRTDARGELGPHPGANAIGRERRDDDLVDVGGIAVGVLQRVDAGPLGEIGQRHLAVEVAALANAGAAHDPVVGRVEVGLEMGVRDDVVGQRRSDAEDAGLHREGPVIVSKQAAVER